MIKQCFYIESASLNPVDNLALEEELLQSIKDAECILYLWRNENTVVLGKNQNAYKECYIERLLEEGGTLVRRPSGGGAVYHDLGNLNFTFLVKENDFDIVKQLQVILIALKKLGIYAEFSGRNDLCIDGRKFSGNAFYASKGKRLHHGTILVNCDMEKMQRYLRPSASKLKSKGVDSVRSRVISLVEVNPELTLTMLKEKILEAFQEVYDVSLKKMNPQLNQEHLQHLKGRYESEEWTMNPKIPFTLSLNHRFSWGEIDLNLNVKNGMIFEAECSSDAMEVDFIEQLKEALSPIPYKEMRKAIEKISCSQSEEIMKQDCLSWLKEEDYE